MNDTQLPDLSFSMVKLGDRATPWDFRRLLYKDGASTHATKVADLITNGALGAPLLDRLELIKRVRDDIAGELASGGSKQTAQSSINSFRRFVAWTDQANLSLSLAEVEETYLHWTDHLLHRIRVVKDLKPKSANVMATATGALLDSALKRRAPIVRQTRLPKLRSRKAALGVAADKQNLEQTFAFGHVLQDICDCLSIEAIWGALPVQITFRSGKVVEQWSGLMPAELLIKKARTADQRRYLKHTMKKREAYAKDCTLRTRFPLVNLRILAELLMFIGQTGINLAQAHKIKTGQFHYTSYLDSYQVRRYKERREGDIEFDIYQEYREHFERYLKWRTTIFPDDPDGLMFPFIRRGRAKDDAPDFRMMKGVCKELGICYIPPRSLRNTRVNWLLRRSQDADMTADMAQHSKQTLLHTYAAPNLQVAMAEISIYHQKNDPAIAPPGPGLCVSAAPEAVLDTPTEATQPDCMSAAGCLFCTQHRDIDSQEHVWSLASFRHLKMLELAKYRPPSQRKTLLPTHPADLAVDRLTAKLKFFDTSSTVRKMWVQEALARIAEAHYHHMWDGFIQLQEAG